MIRRPPESPPFPNTTLSRSSSSEEIPERGDRRRWILLRKEMAARQCAAGHVACPIAPDAERSADVCVPGIESALRAPQDQQRADRKSTRLNSSHANISYAVF